MGGWLSRQQQETRNPDVDTDKIIRKLNESLQAIFQGSAEEVPRILKESMETMRDTVSNGLDGMTQNASDLRVFLQDTVKFFQPYFVILLVSIVLYVLASAWRKLRPVPATQFFNVSYFLPGDVTRAGYWEDQQFGYPGGQRLEHRKVQQVGPVESASMIPGASASAWMGDASRTSRRRMGP
ncbi:hypothetical protein GALMADRAFT_237327 [Galerina marginata CBS 339.88]|uniref:Uncharacterized protein n=1 Tax=Galerina marginata (strain CBS 339.88) TaxID=685588 RepID=A0A067TZI0_GALM3|nr:hypothetical protein GALMADRAFT_237327 [Galerina marginata CBS 339.88]